MIKQYEGNGLNKIYFTSTGRDLEMYDQELKELDNYTSELEDKIQNYRLELKRLQIENQMLYKANQGLQRKGLL